MCLNPVPEQPTPATADEEEDTPTHTQEDQKESMSIHHVLHQTPGKDGGRSL